MTYARDSIFLQVTTFCNKRSAPIIPGFYACFTIFSPRSPSIPRLSIRRSIRGRSTPDTIPNGRADTTLRISPETVLCLRAIAKFETLYLSRSSTRMTDSINAAFGGGYKQPPGSREGMTVSRVMLNEMDSARFDPLLGRNMARLIGKAVDAITGKVDGLVSSRLVLARRAPFADPVDW